MNCKKCIDYEFNDACDFCVDGSHFKEDRPSIGALQIALSLAVVLIVLLLSNCAHYYPKICSKPAMVVLEEDAGMDVVAATREAVEKWNELIGATVFLYAGQVDVERGAYIRIIVKGEGREDKDRGLAKLYGGWQVGGRKCTWGTDILLYYDQFDCWEVLRDVVAHELGHAIGLVNRDNGIMGPVTSCGKVRNIDVLINDVDLLRRRYR